MSACLHVLKSSVFQQHSGNCLLMLELDVGPRRARCDKGPPAAYATAKKAGWKRSEVLVTARHRVPGVHSLLFLEKC